MTGVAVAVVVAVTRERCGYMYGWRGVEEDGGVCGDQWPRAFLLLDVHLLLEHRLLLGDREKLPFAPRLERHLKSDPKQYLLH